MRLPQLRRPPDFTVMQGDKPYLLRWYIIPRNRFFNIYLHKFLRSDEDRAMHDHPWWSVGMILEGSYLEYMPLYPASFRAGSDRRTIAVTRKAFRPVLRGPRHIHRVKLFTGTFGEPRPVWTIFITGPRLREWGFWCPAGFRDWREFTKPVPGGNDTGKGCGE